MALIRNETKYSVVGVEVKWGGNGVRSCEFVIRVDFGRFLRSGEGLILRVFILY